jgi:acyl-CoA reductase-like NAD-dependent aldehyde dehydrogenase
MMSESEPTVFDHVSPGSEIAQNEVFGVARYPMSPRTISR